MHSEKKPANTSGFQKPSSETTAFKKAMRKHTKDASMPPDVAVLVGSRTSPVDEATINVYSLGKVITAVMSAAKVLTNNREAK